MGKATYHNPASDGIDSVSNVVFVNKLGTDATGLPQRFDKQFKTVTNALVALNAFFTGATAPSATNPVFLVVYPGTYVESVTIPTFVHLVSALPGKFMYDGISNASIISKYGDAKGNVYVNGTITLSGNNSNVTNINFDTLIIQGINCSITGCIGLTDIRGFAGAIANCNFYDCHTPLFLRLVSVTSCIFEFCTTTSNSFASSTVVGAAFNIVSCQFYNIIATTNCFASVSAAVGVTAGSISGSYFYNVTVTTLSFSANAGASAGGDIDSATTFDSCFSGASCFCVSIASAGGTFAGLLKNHKATGLILNGFTTKVTVSGLIDNLTLSQTLFGLFRTLLTGTMKNTTVIATTPAVSGIYVGAGGRIINCVIKGDAAAFSVDALGAVTADIRHSDLCGSGYNAVNITLATLTPYNTDEASTLP